MEVFRRKPTMEVPFSDEIEMLCLLSRVRSMTSIGWLGVTCVPSDSSCTSVSIFLTGVSRMIPVELVVHTFWAVSAIVLAASVNARPG